MNILTALLLSLMSTLLLAQHEGHGQSTAPADTLKKSIPKEVHAQLGKAHVMIKYHDPDVRGRMIWGGLVTYDEVWVTGAHRSTSLEVDRTFIVDKKEIPAGKYALFYHSWQG